MAMNEGHSNRCLIRRWLVPFSFGADAGESRMKSLIYMAVLFLTLALVLLACNGLGEAEQHYNAGAELKEEGRLEEAIAEFTEAIRLDPDFALAYSSRGYLYVETGRYDQAIEDLDEAIRLNPKDAIAHLNRGRVYSILGHYDEAIRDFDETIRLNPQDAKAYSNRGFNYERLGEYEKAIQDCSEAIRLDPQLAIAYANRAVAYTLLGRDTEAQDDCDRAIELGFDADLLKQLLQTAKPSEAEYETYVNHEKAFSIAYPIVWQKTEQPIPGTPSVVIHFASPYLEAGGTNPNIIVTIETLPQETTPREHFDKTKEQWDSFTDYTLVSIEDLTINGLPALKHVYSHRQFGIKARQMQVTIIKGRKMALVTAIAADDTFAEYSDIFDAVARTFRFLP